MTSAGEPGRLETAVSGLLESKVFLAAPSKCSVAKVPLSDGSPENKLHTQLCNIWPSGMHIDFGTVRIEEMGKELPNVPQLVGF